jgi:hypothetical protein
MRVRLLLYFVLCASCGKKDTGAANTESTSETDTATPYLADEEDLALPDFDAAALESVLDATLLNLRDLHGAPVFAAYEEALTAGADDDCPYWGTSEDAIFWYGTCTASTGTTFEGYGLLQEESSVNQYGILWSSVRNIYLVGNITAADGSTLKGTGNAFDWVGTDKWGSEYMYSGMSDGFTYDGAAGEDTWLDGTAEPGFSWWAYWNESIGARSMSVSGSVGIDDTEGLVNVIVLDDIVLYNAEFGSICDEEPMGTVSILDDKGNWYDLVFDGPNWGTKEMDPEACDGCADAWFKGISLGSACADFSPLLDWADQPFE